MKGMQGLFIAACLGIIGAVCNWFYLMRLADKTERIAFVGIKSDVNVSAGQKFKASDFMMVEIPLNRLGNLDKAAVRWAAVESVKGFPANKEYFGGELLLQQELKTPAKEDLNKMIISGERVIWLPVDSRTFNPAHVNPGDLVSFRVPDVVARPALANATEPGAAVSEIIGPFRILALGNRKGRREISRAAGVAVGAENVIAISVKTTDNETKLDAMGQRLSEVLQKTNFQGVQLMLHPSDEEDTK